MMYVVTDTNGQRVLEFADVAGVVRWSDGLAESDSVDGTVAAGATAAHLSVIRGSLAVAVDGGHFRSLLRAAGLTVERGADDLAGVQVRISATGHPFVPGHTAGVGKFGAIAGKISAAAASAHAASEHAAAAKSAAFLASGAKTQAHAEEYASAAATHASLAAKHHAAAAAHAQVAPHHAAAARKHAEAAVAHQSAADHRVSQHVAAKRASEAIRKMDAHEEAANDAMARLRSSATATDAARHAKEVEHHVAAFEAATREVHGHLQQMGDLTTDGYTAAEHAHSMRHNDAKVSNKRARAAADLRQHQEEAVKRAQRSAAELATFSKAAETHSANALRATTRGKAEEHAALASIAANDAEAMVRVVKKHADDLPDGAGGVPGDTVRHGFKAAAELQADSARAHATAAQAHVERLAAAESARRPRRTATARPAQPTRVAADDVVGRFFGRQHGVDRAELARVFSADGHFTAHETSASSYGSSLSVEYEIKNASGRNVGRIQRDFTKNEDGSVSVYHAYFQISDTSMQGNGAAKAVFRQSVEMYQRTGVRDIKVTAGLSKGRYVWASYGFQASSREVATFRAGFKQSLERVARSKEREAGYHDGERKARLLSEAAKLNEAVAKTSGIKSMQHLADFEHGGVKLGKDFLLNAEHMPMWHGTIKISPRSASFKRLKQKIGME